MRGTLPLPLLALLLACGRSDRNVGSSAQSSAPSGGFKGPATLVLRIPRAGGTAHVHLYPHMDSVVWRGTDAAPPPASVLGFDDESGTVAYADTKGRAVLLDLRLGSSTVTSRTRLDGLAAASGSIYGIGANGTVVRMTPSGDWTFKPAQPATAVFPQPDGAVIIAAGKGTRARLLKLFPPDTRVLDSLVLPRISGSGRTQLGDQLYLATDTALLVLRTRTMTWQQSIAVDEPIAVMAATPSGDRVFLLSASRGQIVVVDEYRNRVAARFDLPGRAADLRIDPFGRYLLARAADSDSIWVVAVGTQHVIGGVRGSWREDLPAVAYDGTILVASGDDVVGIDGETLRIHSRVRGGAADLWYPFVWDGFRPRSAALDMPVHFDSVRVDTMPPDSLARADSATPATGTAPGNAPAAQASGFIVSFAAFLAPDRAQALAASIKVGTEGARVVSSALGGNTVYRVVLGPYATREEAENTGRESGHSYWVYEGMP